MKKCFFYPQKRDKMCIPVLHPPQQMHNQYTIGVDIGATKILAGLVHNGKIVRSELFLTKQSKKTNKNGIIQTLKEAVNSVWTPKVVGIGLGIAGTTNPTKKIFYSGVNFPKSFRDINLKKELKEFGVVVAVDNDVHCFALGEALFGSGQKFRHVFGMTLGTGLGGALVIDGQIYRGRNNAAGEIGHTTIAFGDGLNESGFSMLGQLEAFASGTGLSRMIAEEYARPFPPEELETRAAQGDRTAERIISTARRAFAVCCANVVLTVNPDVIVVGGGLARMAGLWNGFSDEFRKLIPYAQLRSTPVVKSKLSHYANIFGAAAMVQKELVMDKWNRML